MLPIFTLEDAEVRRGFLLTEFSAVEHREIS